ncbi:DUF1992 domain-containing protein [Microbacterium indicum]|uniref:DnaJ family domain-containing protein n=1 Tax=Microbacterium indicum TaxID=358100 RepID=UPI000424299A|nr:DUF1992 domain-containing protein [Microbacterium indicum]
MATKDPREEGRSVGGPPQWTTREERVSAVEAAIQVAIRRGDFDDLPGAGKPLEGLDRPLEDDWWIRRKIETENLTGIAPPALALRVEHRAMAETLDLLAREEEVREHVADFNRRVRRARMQLEGGPPVVTPLLDADAEVAAWRERREAAAPPAPEPAQRRWWRRA